MATKKKKDQKVDGYTGAAKKTVGAELAAKLRRVPSFQRAVKDETVRKEVAAYLTLDNSLGKKPGTDGFTKAKRYNAAIEHERSNLPKKNKAAAPKKRSKG